MKKEHLLIVAVGFLILGYVLDAVVNPLASQVSLSTPYHFFTIANLSRFPFTYVSVLLVMWPPRLMWCRWTTSRQANLDIEVKIS